MKISVFSKKKRVSIIKRFFHHKNIVFESLPKNTTSNQPKKNVLFPNSFLRAFNQDECHLNACRSFLQLVEDLSIALINTKGTPAKPFHHDSHIESRQSNCKNGRGGTEIEDCCGRNPTHFPFKSDDGRRKCCGTKTIDTKHQQCCNDIPCQVGDLF